MRRNQRALCAAVFFLVALVDWLAMTNAEATQPYRRRYKYYLDASRAEEVLAGISLHPQLLDDDWLRIVGPQRDERYEIRRGDTLWRISGRQFGNPRLWRKLWEVNAYITNPHELTVGQILQYYREGDRLAAAGSAIPLIKLIPGGRHGYDLDSDEMYQKDLRNRFLPSIQIVREQEILGEITGAYSDGEWLRELDEIYVNFASPSGVKKNDRYSLVRYDRTLVDTTQKSRPVLGFLMRLIGEIRIVGFGEGLARAELVSQMSPVQRGDSIIALRKPVEQGAYFNPPPELQPRVLAGDAVEKSIFGDGEVLLLNKGKSDGMRDGLLFRVYRDTDTYTKKRGDTEPSFKAEIQVIQVGLDASVGVIKRSQLPVELGDTLVPTQAFPEPEVVKGRQVQSLEID